jgi:hypothetical protein
VDQARIDDPVVMVVEGKDAMIRRALVSAATTVMRNSSYNYYLVKLQGSLRIVTNTQEGVQ